MNDVVQNAIMNLARESKSWKSIDINLHTDMHYLISLGLPGGEPAPEKTTHYIETSDGKRLLIEKFQTRDGKTDKS